MRHEDRSRKVAVWVVVAVSFWLAVGVAVAVWVAVGVAFVVVFVVMVAFVVVFVVMVMVVFVVMVMVAVGAWVGVAVWVVVFWGCQVMVRIRLMSEHAVVPVQRAGDAGADLHATYDVTVLPRSVAQVDFAVAFEIPEGFGGLVKSRSGLAKAGHLVEPGLIDSSYRGPVGATLHNATMWPWLVKRGDRVAQIVILPVPVVEFDPCAELSETERGAKGFGSTGVKRIPGNGG